MTKRVEHSCSESELAKWLVSAMESHTPSQQIQEMLVSRFGLRDDEAITAQRCAYAGISRAISGSRKRMPTTETDPIGFAAFNLVWDTFNQNSFFDKRHTPSRKWLDWKDQEKYRYPD
jgi:hypothetical protein